MADVKAHLEVLTWDALFCRKLITSLGGVSSLKSSNGRTMAQGTSYGAEQDFPWLLRSGMLKIMSMPETASGGWLFARITRGQKGGPILVTHKL